VVIEQDAKPESTNEARANAGEVSLGSIWKTLGPAGPLAVIAATLPGISGLVLAGYMTTVSTFLREQGENGMYIYMAAFALTSGLALLPTVVQAVLGGFAFGVLRGIPAALGGFVVGSIIGYEVARRVSGDRVVQAINKHPKMKAVRDAFVDERVGRGFLKTLGIVILLRLPPNSPFAVTNLLLASVRVPRLPYLLGTAIGMAPRTAAAVIIGAGIAEAMEKAGSNNPDFAARPAWYLPVGIAVTVLVLAVLGLLANRAMARVAGSGPERVQ